MAHANYFQLNACQFLIVTRFVVTVTVIDIWPLRTHTHTHTHSWGALVRTYDAWKFIDARVPIFTHFNAKAENC